MRWIADAWWRLVRFGFRLLYNEMAFTYDTVSRIVSRGAWRDWQRAVFEFLPPPESSVSVLEIAHGTGDLQIDLHERGYHAIGYDLSPYMGRITTRKLRKKSIIPRLARGLAQALPFPDSCFPAVVVTFPTHFIFDGRTLREVWRVLHPDGLLIAVLNGELTGSGFVDRAIERLYAITGQRPREDDEYQQADRQIIALLAGYGYEANLHIISLERSAVTVLIARKIPLARD